MEEYLHTVLNELERLLSDRSNNTYLTYTTDGNGKDRASMQVAILLPISYKKIKQIAAKLNQCEFFGLAAEPLCLNRYGGLIYRLYRNPLTKASKSFNQPAAPSDNLGNNTSDLDILATDDLGEDLSFEFDSLLGEERGDPLIIEQLARALSMGDFPVITLCAWAKNQANADDMVQYNQLTAKQYRRGQLEKGLPPGLILAQFKDSLMEILLEIDC